MVDTPTTTTNDYRSASLPLRRAETGHCTASISRYWILFTLYYNWL